MSAGKGLVTASSSPRLDPAGPDRAILQRLDHSEFLRGPSRIIESLPGGLTNQNFKVTLPGGSYVARLSGRSTELLAIDRAAEFHHATIAAHTGIAPKVVDYRPEVAMMVVEWVSGKTLSERDLTIEGALPRVVQACRTLHAGPAFSSEFNMFAIQRRYLDTVQRHGFRLPDGYLDFAPQLAQVSNALAERPPALVPCHNDLLAENFIDNGERIWIIDFEYSGSNDPCFELGNIASESHLSLQALEELVHLYFLRAAGPSLSALVARVRLQALMSQYGWTLWGVIQHGSSTLEVDFWSWAMEKYQRAASMFTSSTFSRLLDAAAEP